jgi:hypothetical protein
MGLAKACFTKPLTSFAKTSEGYALGTLSHNKGRGN